MSLREIYGGLDPRIVLRDTNLIKIGELVRMALMEDTLEGGLLTPKMNQIRFRGGPLDSETLYNLREHQVDVDPLIV